MPCIEYLRQNEYNVDNFSDQEGIMLKNMVFAEKPEEAELKERLKGARDKLYNQQMKLKAHKVPVLVLVEGWGTAGKGSVIGRIIQNIDPRFFKVSTMDLPTEEERRKPFLCRYFTRLPEEGKFIRYLARFLLLVLCIKARRPIHVHSRNKPMRVKHMLRLGDYSSC